VFRAQRSAIAVRRIGDTIIYSPHISTLGCPSMHEPALSFDGVALSPQKETVRDLFVLGDIYGLIERLKGVGFFLLRMIFSENRFPPSDQVRGQAFSGSCALPNCIY
jgi:hypothetical protein